MKRTKKSMGSVLVEYLLLTTAVVTAGGIAAQGLADAHAKLVQNLIESIRMIMGG